MKKSKSFILLGMCIAVVLSGCSVPKQWVAIGGSRSDATVRLGYTYSLFQVPKLEPGQGIEVASEKCRAWGFNGAEAFGGATKQCIDFDKDGCNSWQVISVCQCVGNGNSSTAN